MTSLVGKKVVVTGGAGVLGSAVAETAKAHGAEVVLLDVVEKFPLDLGATHTVDLTDAAAVGACFEKIGDFDALANIAGGFDNSRNCIKNVLINFEQLFLFFFPNKNLSCYRAILNKFLI